MGFPAGHSRRAALAWLALAGMLFMSTGPLALGHPALDTDCVPAVSAEHDHAAHRMGEAPDRAAGHCVACHLTRSARSAMAPAALPTAAVDVVEAVAYADESARAIGRCAALSRGPPSLL